MGYLIILFITLFFALFFYITFRNEFKRTKNINLKIIDDARNKGFNPVKLLNPNSNEWSNCPFEVKIRIGYYAHFGIPSGKEYYRIVEISNNKDEIEKWWVRVINRPKKELSFEWIKSM